MSFSVSKVLVSLRWSWDYDVKWIFVARNGYCCCQVHMLCYLVSKDNNCWLLVNFLYIKSLKRQTFASIGVFDSFKAAWLGIKKTNYLFSVQGTCRYYDFTVTILWYVLRVVVKHVKSRPCSKYKYLYVVIIRTSWFSYEILNNQILNVTLCIELVLDTYKNGGK